MSDRPRSRSAGLRDTAERLLPLGTRRRDSAAAAFEFLKLGRRLGADTGRLLADFGDLAVAGGKVVTASGLPLPAEPYPLWLARRRVNHDRRRQQAHISQRATDPIRISMVVLASGPEAAAAPTRRSLAGQSWPHLQAVVVGHQGRPAPWPEAAAAAETGSGRDYVVFLRAGDVLEPDSAFHIADVAWRDPGVDLVYWDDDLIGACRVPTNPRFRPAWSPETLLGANYLGRSFAIRRRRLVAAGGLDPARGDDCLWDLLLRCRFRADQVARIPRVLGHLAGRADTVADAGLDVVRDHLAAIGESADVEAWNGVARIRWRLATWPLVTIVIPTRHNRPLLESCLAGLAGTDYPDFEVVVVDNGGRTDERSAWYDTALPGIDLRVLWWDQPFNYSAVNNAAAGQARGDILVFLNDDTEAIDPAWLKEMVCWATRPHIGVVGMQLIDGSGRIQHGGVVLAMQGLAEHLFQGMTPGDPSLLGPTRWYRNMLAATGACLALSRADFEQVGGFDERFVLCGSDVVLGLETAALGRRNICLPFPMMRHFEGATRNNHVPSGDVFASYWRYQRWIFGGDPYFSPSLSLASSEPKLKPLGELTPGQRLGRALGRNFEAYRQTDDDAETRRMATICRATSGAVAANHQLQAGRPGAMDVGTVNWFVPDIDSPFYGGISTALRIADHLARHHGVENRFVLWSDPNEPFIRSALSAAFPALGQSPIFFHQSPLSESLADVPEADVAIATQWVTAYSVTNFTKAARKAYLIQDFEPMFYPAGTLFALAEATYRMGLYGVCNSSNLERIYRESYRGQGMAFTPAVDRTVFHPHRRLDRARGDPVTVFLYSRPGHWRNCWELASVALAEAKHRLGDRVRFVTAGSWARPDDIGTGITHLGLLDYRGTGALYRTCDIGIALTVSEHPSYLPLELMACGTAVISFDKDVFSWLLRDGENCLRAALNVDGLVEAIERLVTDAELRRQIAKQALVDIDRDFSSWERSLSGVYQFLRDPT